MTEHEEVLRQLHAAAASPEPFRSVQAVAQQALDDDLSSDTVYALILLLHQTDLPEAVIEQVEDVMDLVWGWCAPDARTVRRDARMPTTGIPVASFGGLPNVGARVAAAGCGRPVGVSRW